VYFAGGVPHQLDGTPIPNIGGGATTLALSSACVDVAVQRSFSNKPNTGSFEDFFAKVESYVAIISGPAMDKYGVSPLTRRAVTDDTDDAVFKLPDTVTSRAGVMHLASRLENDIVAIIGLGGTGSYVLDFLVKTPVREIRGFDNDIYCVHNAYRSPGRLELGELGHPKSRVFASRYDNFRRGLRIEQCHIDRSAAQQLDGVTFAFVCVDKGSARAEVFDLLMERQIPFIDVGMGLSTKTGALSGMLRTTYYSAPDAAFVRAEGLAELVDADEDLYRENVQIAELNALNAAFAVLKYKKLRGYYHDAEAANHVLFDLSDLKTVMHWSPDAD
jgi:hypothetical protein